MTCISYHGTMTRADDLDAHPRQFADGGIRRGVIPIVAGTRASQACSSVRSHGVAAEQYAGGRREERYMIRGMTRCFHHLQSAQDRKDLSFCKDLIYLDGNGSQQRAQHGDHETLERSMDRAFHRP